MRRLVSRYHPALVTLHWLLAVAILGMLAVGALYLAQAPNTDPHKIDVLEIHMATGMAILALMVLRLLVRSFTSRPAPAATGHSTVDRLAPLAHVALYLLVVAMVATGYATGIVAGLPAIVFQRTGAPLPASFAGFPTFTAHVWLAGLLAGLITIHVVAALYHQVVVRDRLMGRMGFGRRALP